MARIRVAHPWTSSVHLRGSARVWSGVGEIALIAVLYVGYTVTRVFASDDRALAGRHAADVLRVERWTGLDVEHAVNGAFAPHTVLAAAASFYYAVAHYLVTAVVLVWLWLRRPVAYLPARRALVAASLVALAIFLVLPTAPPRLYGGYQDVLALTSDVGWWGASASAPKGMGGLTNEFAAMPSMHVGWAVWCALAIRAATNSPVVRAVVWVYPVATTLVVIGTGNHWTLDAVVAVVIVAAAWFAFAAKSDRSPGAVVQT